MYFLYLFQSSVVADAEVMSLLLLVLYTKHLSISGFGLPVSCLKTHHAKAGLGEIVWG